MRCGIVAGAVSLAVIGCEPPHDAVNTIEGALAASPAGATAVPADYSGACGALNPPRHNCGMKDISVRSTNGNWYIDLAGNGLGSGAQPPPSTRWDRVYLHYGFTGVPVPADYDGDFKDDLAIKDNDGRWYIDYAANGLGSWDVSYAGYGGPEVIPVPADYDGDGKADLAIMDPSGNWYIDYSSNGFGGWNEIHHYPGRVGIPVPGDYDGDGRADIAEKDSNGVWKIAYAHNGFTGVWDVQLAGYGVGTPVPADYDNDHKTDIAMYTATGDWFIDFAWDGFGAWNIWPPFSGYGGSWATPVPGDYDHDGLVDLAVKDNNNGLWWIDFASNGFHGWDPPSPIDNVNRQLADTGRPYIASTRVFGEGGQETYQLMVGVRYTVDVTVQPGSASANTACDPKDDLAACVSGSGLRLSQCLHGACVDPASVEVNPQLQVPAALNVRAATGTTFWPIESTSCANDNQCGERPDLSGECNTTTKRCNTHRRFALTCTQPGNFPLGFQLRNTPLRSNIITADNPDTAFNPDYGIRVGCSTTSTGLYGRVTSRVLDSVTKVYKPGSGLANAKVTIQPTNQVVHTDLAGNWQANVSGGPMTVTVSGPGCPGMSCQYSDTVAVNLTVPATGFQLDTPLEESFAPIHTAGMTYTTYLDYSHGRTVMHTLRVTTFGSVNVAQAPFDPQACNGLRGPNTNLCSDASNGSLTSCPSFHPMINSMATTGALAAINGVWWDPCTGASLGYMRSVGFPVPSEPSCDGGTPVFPQTSSSGCTGGNWFFQEGADPDHNVRPALMPQSTMPLFGVSGSGVSQNFTIAQSDSNFLENPSTQWTQSIGGPIWDVNRDGVSDVFVAAQIGNPPLLYNGHIVAGGDFGLDLARNYDYTFARTAIGVVSTATSSTVMYLVIADGEGVQGGNGATGNQLGHFFKDVLHATAAMALDSGLSTQMILKTNAGTYRRVNTVSGEDSRIQMDPYSETYDFLHEQPGGEVANFIFVTNNPGQNPNP